MTKITALTSLTSGQVDRATDVLEIADVSASTSKKITPNALMGISGVAVGDTDSQTLTNKTITAPNISSPVLSGTLTGTYTIGGTPTFPSSVVTLTGSQTLTNKVLTSPTINTATISNPTLTVDTVSEFTAANGVTIDGVLLKDSKINGSYITDDTITDTILDYPRWWQEIGRTTLGVAGDTITVSSIPARKYLKFVFYWSNTGGTVSVSFRFNGDTGTNYTFRYDASNTPGSSTSQTSIGSLGGNTGFGEMEVLNVATLTKVGKGISAHGTSTAATAMDYLDLWFKWVNTTDQITSITFTNGGTGDFTIGSEIVVLGHN